MRWEVKDEHLDLKTLVLEYQVEGAKEWRKVPIRRPSLLGAERWDAGTADSLRVRATVADKAGNVADAEIVMPEGAAGDPDFAAVDAESPRRLLSSRFPAPVHRSSRGRASRRSRKAPGQGPVPRPDPHPADPWPGAQARWKPVRRCHSPCTRLGWQRRDGSWRTPGAINDSGSGTPAAAAPAFADPFPMNDAAGAAGQPGAGTNTPSRASRRRGTAPCWYPAPRFKLQYAIEDAGPDGPAVVELWMTQDGGRNWIRRGEDPDRISPLEVDLGGEGTFGLSLVARSASGLGDQPPAPGDPPQTWVEVDTTPPSVQLYPPQIGTGPHAGKVAITWRASDLHLAPRRFRCSGVPTSRARPGSPSSMARRTWASSSGRYLPASPPSSTSASRPSTALGHRGGAETTDSAPVIVDRSRPRSRIIGLDPNARAGDGPGARPLR